LTKKLGISVFLVSFFVFSLFVVGGTKSTPIEGIVSYWRFEEGVGTIAHDSVDINHGTLINGPTWSTGLVSKALQFDGVDDYVETSHSPLDPAATDFTAEVWIKMASLASSDHDDIIQQMDGAGTGRGWLYVSTINDNEIKSYLGGAETTTGVVPIVGEWYHVALTKSGTTIKIYVNGDLKVTSTRTVEPANGALRFGKGKATGIHEQFNGTIDEIAIYNRVLTSEEIQQHYNSGLSGKGYSIGISGWSTWFEPFDNNTNGWTFVNGASISGGVIDTSPTYSRGLNSLDFLDNLTIDSMTIDYDAYRSSSSSAIVGVIFSYLDYKIFFNWNYYGPHSVNGVYYRNSTHGVKVPLPQESGWRKMRIVLKNLATDSPRANYYFENEGVLKTIAENQTLCYYPGLPDLPESTAIRIGNGFSGTVQYDNLTISYLLTVPEYNLTIYSSPTGVPFTVNSVANTTPWSEIYYENTSVSLVMPEIHTVGDAKYYWDQWSDGNTSRSRTVIMTTNLTLTAYYTGPYYELTITSSPITGIPFNINGMPQTTTYTDWLLEGSYTLEMPETYNEYVWSHWLEDEDTNRIKTITLPGTTWTAVYTIPPPPVGGTTASINSEHLSSWIAAILLIITITIASSIYFKHKKP